MSLSITSLVNNAEDTETGGGGGGGLEGTLKGGDQRAFVLMTEQKINKQIPHIIFVMESKCPLVVVSEHA